MHPLLFGLGMAGCFAVFVAGWRMARADTLEGWEVADIALLRDATKQRRTAGPLDRFARRMSPKLAMLLGPRLLANLRRRIELAGRPDGMTVDSFLQLVVKYALVLGTTGIVMLALGSRFPALLTFISIPLLPVSRLAGQQRRRRSRIDQDLPDFLDVLAVTVGAGIGFRQALERVTARSEGPLAEELTATLHQLDVGVSRRAAFTSLRERCDSEPMSSFVTAFLQAEELGAPLGETLTIIGRDSRREAAQRARQNAARTVPRVTLLVSMVMVPPTIGVIAAGMYLGSGLNISGILG